MTISFNHSSSVSSENTLLYKEGFLPSLTVEQNKIALIIFAVFGLLAVGYTIHCNRINFKARLLNGENKTDLEKGETIPLNGEKKTRFGNILSILPMMAR